MKILALRGENLASLQSRFEIDFSDSRLGDAGLFAITGKTGAGKSTLLDAICLALYGGIPRLQANKKNDAEIGRDDDDNRIKANDVRSILSRGKGEAFAEVDFLADDGTHWCAHWSVRRARTKVDGRIQAAEQWLENLDTSQRFAGKKQELQNEIQRLIGLSFEQFRRAVMLPQGEFAAFLKAAANERAELLERMTGGEIYSRLSVLAYERARTEKENYKQLQAKLGDVVLLSSDEKQTLNAQTEQLKQQSTTLNKQLAELKQHQDILAATAKLQQRVTEAQTSADTTRQALTESEPRHQHLTLLEKVQPAHSDFSLLQQAQMQLAKLRRSLNTTQSELPVKEQLKQDRDEQVATNNETLAKARQDWRTLEPELRAAQKLEQQLEGIQQQLDEQKKEQQQQDLTSQEQEKALAQLNTQRAELQQARQMLSEKLAQDQAIQAISQQYDAIRDNVAQYLKAQQAQAGLQNDKQKIADEQLAHKKQQDTLATQLKQLSGKKNGCEAQIVDTDLVTLEQLHHQELSQYANKQQFRDLLHQVMSALKEWLSLLTQAEKTQAQQTALQNSIHQMQQNLTALLPELKALKIRHSECEHLMQKSREVMQLSDHRAELRPNEACPLCGSTEHPYANDNPLADGLLQTQQQHLNTLTEELKTQEARLSHLEQSIPGEQERLSTCQEDLAGFTQQISDIYQRYAVLFDSLELANALNEQTERNVLEQQLTAWEQEITRGAVTLKELKLANEQRAQQIKRARDAQDELLKLQEQENVLSTEINVLTQQATQWKERLQSLDTQYEIQGEILQARATTLQTQFDNDSWQQSLEKSGEKAFFAQLETNTQQYRKDQQALTDAEQQHSALAPKIAATQEALEHIRSQLTKQDTRISELADLSQALKKQRETLVAEQDLAELELKHQQAIETAQENLLVAQKTQNDAGEELAVIQATLTGLKQQAADAESDQQKLQQKWLEWQQKLALDETQLSELLAYDENWLSEERAALKSIEQTAGSAQVTLKARLQDLLEQEVLAEISREWLADQETTDGGAEGDTGQQNKLTASWQQQKDELDEQIFQYRQQLIADEQARSKAGNLTQQLATQQEQYELWEKMNELIGSANGSKFRSLAQSLTLQQLVILANEHLQDLAPRYALQPVPGSGLALQVIDHDMGDEVRSVESLSGGESFLVSLALALALASLAADTRQLGSLFIDEGFGTLDPDSLEMALACLDALQADGRQIGVISHVSTLVERIGVQVKVESVGGGQSRVLVSG